MIKYLLSTIAVIATFQFSAKAFSTVAIQSFEIDCNCSNPSYQGTVGYDFTVNTVQNINLVGVYDSTGDGLDFAKQVGVWDKSTNLLLASATVPAGTGSVLDGQFRYVPISLITLVPGKTYTAGAYYDQYGPDFYQLITKNNIFSPWFNYLNPAEVGGSFGLPNNVGQPPYGIYGPNLALEVPGPLPIAGAAMAFTTSRQIRRRIRLMKPVSDA